MHSTYTVSIWIETAQTKVISIYNMLEYFLPSHPILRRDMRGLGSTDPGSK